MWFDLSDKEMELLTEALKYHSDGYTRAIITVQVCWDADRLDLGRVGIKPAPHRLNLIVVSFAILCGGELLQLLMCRLS